MHAIDTYLAEDEEVVPLGSHDGEKRYTTERILEAECRMLHGMDLLTNRSGNTLHEWEVERELKKHPTLSPEQVNFVRHLTLTDSALRIGLGLAGTGKTHALKACVNAWKRRGFRVLVAAPTGQAARVLGKATGADGETLTKLLGDYRLPLSAAVKHHARQLARVVRRRRTWRFRQPQPGKLSPNTIVLVDEAGMMNVAHATKLAEWVEREKCTLSLIGDPIQLPAIDSVSPLQALARRYGAAKLTDIRRQKDVWARVAARIFADGDPAAAMEIFAARNKITVRETLEETVQQACLDWTAEGLLTPHRAIILTNTNDLAHNANQLCQGHRLRAGTILNTASTLITDETDDAIFESRVYVGERVLFTKNSRGRRGYGVDNGSLGTVTAISPFGSQISVSLDDGSSVTVDTAKFHRIRLGYSITTYKSQGASIPKVFVLLAGNADLQNLPASYVQATRAIEDTQFYTTRDLLDLFHNDLQGSPLIKRMSRRPDLRLANELLEDALRDLSAAEFAVPEPTSETLAAPATTANNTETETANTASSLPEGDALQAEPRLPQSHEEQPTDMASTQHPSAVDQSPEQELTDEQSPDQQPTDRQEVPDEPQLRKNAQRLKRIQLARQAWKTHTHQEQADARERERLTENAKLQAFRERLKALHQKRAEFAESPPRPTDGSPSDEQAAAYENDLTPNPAELANDTTHVDRASDNEQTPNDFVRQPEQPAPWHGEATSDSIQQLTAADFHEKRQSVRRRREEVQRGGRQTPNASISEAPNSNEPSADRPQPSTESPAPHLSTLEQAYRQARQDTLRKRRQESFRRFGNEACCDADSRPPSQHEPAHTAALQPVPQPPLTPAPQPPLRPQPQISPEQAELERKRREEAQRQTRERIRQLLLLRVKERLREPQAIDQQPTHSVADQVVQQLLTRFHEVEEITQEQSSQALQSHDDPMSVHPGVQQYEVTTAELDLIQQQFGLQFSHYDSLTFPSEPIPAQAADPALPQSAALGHANRGRTVYIPPCSNCGGARCGNFGTILHVTDP
ncbi:MAG: AAA family ATPase [Pirellulaceae bacterium]